MDGTQLKAQYKTGERNFRSVVLSGVNLVWVELKGVDLRGADLSQANLSGADLSGSDLSDGTNLTFADLSRADLRNTNLKGTRLEGTNLEGVQLEGAVYDETTKFPRGFDPRMVGGIPGGSLAQKSESQKSEPKTKAEEPERERLQDEPRTSNQDFESSTTKILKEDLRTPNPDRFVAPTELSDRPNLIEEVAEQVKDTFSDAIASWQQTSPPDWNLTPANLSDLSSNSSGQGKTSQIPAGIKGWNWGAFLLPWLWFVPNQVWGGIVLWLLSLIPGWNIGFALIFAIAFGLNGNEWAWKARPWDSAETFRKHQRLWAIIGFLVWGLIIFVTLSSKR
jgi:Pentapeptide repeats (8 copies)